jgi:hypothetical protein
LRGYKRTAHRSGGEYLEQDEENISAAVFRSIFSRPMRLTNVARCLYSQTKRVEAVQIPFPL